MEESQPDPPILRKTGPRHVGVWIDRQQMVFAFDFQFALVPQRGSRLRVVAVNLRSIPPMGLLVNISRRRLGFFGLPRRIGWSPGDVHWCTGGPLVIGIQ